MTDYKFKIGDKVRVKDIERTNAQLGAPKNTKVEKEFIINHCKLSYKNNFPIYSENDNCDWIVEEDLELVTDEEIQVGDEVEIIGNSNPNHHLKIGSIGKVIHIEEFAEVEGEYNKEKRTILQDVNKKDIRKITKTNNMTTKQFKNNFGVTSDSEALLEAFAKEAEKLGWKYQKSSSEKWKNLFFNGTENQSLKNLQKGCYWKCALFGTNKVYNLPTQWEEAIKAASETIEIKEEFKVGDWVVVEQKPTSWADAAGGKYSMDIEYPHIGKILTMKEVSVSEGDLVAYNISGYGFSQPAYKDNNFKLRKATKEEIEKATPVNISGYTAEVKNGKIAFGCQAFTKEQLETYLNLLNRKEFKAEIIINKEPITKETLQKLLNKLK